MTVADDVSTDLYCTLFDILEREGREYAFPRHSVAVQVKSDRGRVEVTGKIEYLAKLEVPYYVGVVDGNALTLTLYSGRYLPHMFAYRGSPVRLRLVPQDRPVEEYYRSGDDERGYDVACPIVTTLCAQDTKEQLADKRGALQADALAALSAIVSGLNKEFIFDIPGGVEIFAGRTSVQVFRSNFWKRLAEAFYNLAWLLDQGGSVDADEIEAYLAVDRIMTAREARPPYVELARQELLRAMGSA